MNETNTGGPAFPDQYKNGMTLRDYFAAKALQGLVAGTLQTVDTSLIARDCYVLADAMLKARKA
jgi:hypothetical protein